jgi:hypothetical protein
MALQYGAYALRSGLARLHERMRMHTPPHPGTHTHELTHAHRPVSNNLIAFVRQQQFANAPQCYVIRALPYSL